MIGARDDAALLPSAMPEALAEPQRRPVVRRVRAARAEAGALVGPHSGMSEAQRAT